MRAFRKGVVQYLLSAGRASGESGWFADTTTGVTIITSSVSLSCVRCVRNKWPSTGICDKPGRPSLLLEDSRDKKPANTNVCPERTLNSVAARRVFNGGPPGGLNDGSTELTSTSMLERTMSLRSICGVMRRDTPYGLNSVLVLPLASTTEYGISPPARNSAAAPLRARSCGWANATASPFLTWPTLMTKALMPSTAAGLADTPAVSGFTRPIRKACGATIPTQGTVRPPPSRHPSHPARANNCAAAQPASSNTMRSHRLSGKVEQLRIALVMPAGARDRRPTSRRLQPKVCRPGGYRSPVCAHTARNSLWICLVFLALINGVVVLHRPRPYLQGRRPSLRAKMITSFRPL